MAETMRVEYLVQKRCCREQHEDYVWFDVCKASSLSDAQRKCNDEDGGTYRAIKRTITEEVL